MRLLSALYLSTVSRAAIFGGRKLYVPHTGPPKDPFFSAARKSYSVPYSQLQPQRLGFTGIGGIAGGGLVGFSDTRRVFNGAGGHRLDIDVGGDREGGYGGGVSDFGSGGGSARSSRGALDLRVDNIKHISRNDRGKGSGSGSINFGRDNAVGGHDSRKLTIGGDLIFSVIPVTHRFRRGSGISGERRNGIAYRGQNGTGSLASVGRFSTLARSRSKDEYAGNGGVNDGNNRHNHYGERTFRRGSQKEYPGRGRYRMGSRYDAGYSSLDDTENNPERSHKQHIINVKGNSDGRNVSRALDVYGGLNRADGVGGIGGKTASGGINYNRNNGYRRSDKSGPKIKMKKRLYTNGHKNVVPERSGSPESGGLHDDRAMLSLLVPIFRAAILQSAKHGRHTADGIPFMAIKNDKSGDRGGNGGGAAVSGRLFVGKGRPYPPNSDPSPTDSDLFPANIGHITEKRGGRESVYGKRGGSRTNGGSAVKNRFVVFGPHIDINRPYPTNRGPYTAFVGGRKGQHLDRGGGRGGVRMDVAVPGGPFIGNGGASTPKSDHYSADSGHVITNREGREDLYDDKDRRLARGGAVVKGRVFTGGPYSANNSPYPANRGPYSANDGDSEGLHVNRGSGRVGVGGVVAVPGSAFAGNSGPYTENSYPFSTSNGSSPANSGNITANRRGREGFYGGRDSGCASGGATVKGRVVAGSLYTANNGPYPKTRRGDTERSASVVGRAVAVNGGPYTAASNPYPTTKSPLIANLGRRYGLYGERGGDRASRGAAVKGRVVTGGPFTANSVPYTANVGDRGGLQGDKGGGLTGDGKIAAFLSRADTRTSGSYTARSNPYPSNNILNPTNSGPSTANIGGREDLHLNRGGGRGGAGWVTAVAGLAVNRGLYTENRDPYPEENDPYLTNSGTITENDWGREDLYPERGGGMADGGAADESRLVDGGPYTANNAPNYNGLFSENSSLQIANVVDREGLHGDRGSGQDGSVVAVIGHAATRTDGSYTAHSIQTYLANIGQPTANSRESLHLVRGSGHGDTGNGAAVAGSAVARNGDLYSANSDPYPRNSGPFSANSSPISANDRSRDGTYWERGGGRTGGGAAVKGHIVAGGPYPANNGPFHANSGPYIANIGGRKYLQVVRGSGRGGSGKVVAVLGRAATRTGGSYTANSAPYPAISGQITANVGGREGLHLNRGGDRSGAASVSAVSGSEVSGNIGPYAAHSDPYHTNSGPYPENIGPLTANGGGKENLSGERGGRTDGDAVVKDRVVVSGPYTANNGPYLTNNGQYTANVGNREGLHGDRGGDRDGAGKGAEVLGGATSGTGSLYTANSVHYPANIGSSTANREGLHLDRGSHHGGVGAGTEIVIRAVAGGSFIINIGPSPTNGANSATHAANGSPNTTNSGFIFTNGAQILVPVH